MTYANVAATLALALALTSPAWGDPVANSAASVKKTAAKALGLGKKANKTAKKANKTANTALTTAKQALAQGGKPGAQGATGLQGKTGLQGPRGLQGQTGLQGPPGPTFASFSGEDPTEFPQFLATPAVNPTLATTFTTPSSGRLLAVAQYGPLTIDCTSAGNAATGLYVDGAPVPTTRRRWPDAETNPFSVTGVTSTTVAAGNHTVALGVQCDLGTVNSIAVSQGFSIGAVLLGG